MDEDFQQRYQSAERAFGGGEYAEAGRIARRLLNELETTTEEKEAQDAALSWRAFIALLLGHIELYGEGDFSQASDFYQMVLDSQPHDTLKELAQQGLERAGELTEIKLVEAGRASVEPDAVQKSTSTIATPEILRDPFLQEQNQYLEISTSTSTVATPEILRDPFLQEQPPQEHAQPATTQTVWEPEHDPITDSVPESAISETAREPLITSEADPAVTHEPEADFESRPEPEPRTELESLSTDETDPEPDPMELLNGTLLRVRLPARSTNAKAGESLAESPGSSWLQRLLQRR